MMGTPSRSVRSVVIAMFCLIVITACQGGEADDALDAVGPDGTSAPVAPSTTVQATATPTEADGANQRQSGGSAGGGACAELTNALADTISIQEDLMINPDADFETRFFTLDRKVGSIGDAAVKNAGMEYVKALRLQVAAAKAGDQQAMADNAEQRIGPALAAIGKLDCSPPLPGNG